MLELLEALISSTCDYAPALILASLGAVLSERAGVVNVGIEGMMRVGAFAAAVAALVMPTGIAVGVGMLAGGALAALHGVLCVKRRADQVVSGMALNLVALAGGTYLLESQFSATGTPSIRQLHRWALPLLEGVPLLRGFSRHSALTYLAAVLAVALHVFLYRTAAGLRVRTLGERPEVAAALGLSVAAQRFACVVGSGLLAGLGGAALSTSTLDRFEHNMPSGLGFMAVAAMVFGRWTPLGAFGAATFFALANALRIGLASSAPEMLQVIPQGVLLAMPYALTLAVLAAQRHRGSAPAALGAPFEPERR